MEEVLGWDMIPAALKSPNMTVGELGELKILQARLATLGESLRPRVKLDLFNVPPDASPSMCLDSTLRLVQNGMDRAAGSNLGDSHIAALALYADAVEVDKRTHEHLRQIKWRDKRFAELLCPTFRCSTYVEMPAQLQQLLP